MIEVAIGMTRDRMRQLAEELSAATLTDVGLSEVEFQGEVNGEGDEVVVRISNDDMERPEVEDSIFVDIEDEGDSG